VKVGIPLFMLRHDQLVPVARRAEELGFESVWVAEHLVFPTTFKSRYPYTADGVPPINPATPLLDPLLVLAQIAGATSRIRLGTNIYVLPLRHPLVTARLGVTLDVLSNGRFSFGVGVGWLEEEFVAAGVDFARRGALLRESVRALRTLWTEDVPEFHGKTFAFGPVKFEPKPVQQPLPILVGGESDAALRRAAELGDGWYGVRHTPESVEPVVAKLDELRKAAGRDHLPFEISVGPSAASLDRDVLARFADAGVHRVVSLPWTRAREAMDGLARFAETVL
jgi:probable F420-dependent oxidoreductase